MLLRERGIIILAIARTYLAEMILYTVLIYNRWFNYCAGESRHLVMDQRLESKAHGLQIKPQFRRDEALAVSFRFIGPVTHPVIEFV